MATIAELVGRKPDPALEVQVAWAQREQALKAEQARQERAKARVWAKKFSPKPSETVLVYGPIRSTWGWASHSCNGFDPLDPSFTELMAQCEGCRAEGRGFGR